MGLVLVTLFPFKTSHTNSPGSVLSSWTFFPASLMQAPSAFRWVPFSSHRKTRISLLATLQDNSAVPSGKHWMPMVGSGHTQHRAMGTGRKERGEERTQQWTWAEQKLPLPAIPVISHLLYQGSTETSNQTLECLHSALKCSTVPTPTLLVTLSPCFGDANKIWHLFTFLTNWKKKI